MTRAFALACALLLGTAAADIHLPGSSVSYKVKADPLTGGNASMVFIDAAEDPSGQSYMTFACELGDTTVRLYSRAALGAFSGQPITVQYHADSGRPRYGTGQLRQDTKSGRLSVLEMNAQSLDTLRLFLSAQRQVTLRVGRPAGGPLTFHFPVGGFVQAYRAVQSCD